MECSPWPPAGITEATPTKIYVADKSTFKELVQRLTGQQAAPAEAVVQQDGTAPAPATVAAGSSAPHRGILTVRRMATAVQKPAFKPPHQHQHLSKLPVIRPARPRLAPGFVSPSPTASSPPAPWGPDGPCILNKQVELPPSPPSASTLAEEIDEAAGQKKLEDMHQSVPPPLPPVKNRREPKLLNLFPLTSSYSKDC